MSNQPEYWQPSKRAVLIGLGLASLFLLVVLLVGLSWESIEDGMPPSDPTVVPNPSSLVIPEAR